MNESLPDIDPGGHRKIQFPFFIGKIVMLSVGGLVVMLLWNSVVTDLVTIKSISYLQSVGLLLLTRILTGGFGPERGGFRGRNRFGGPPRHIIEKWKTMSPEERQKFKEEWRARCSMRGRKG